MGMGAASQLSGCVMETMTVWTSPMRLIAVSISVSHVASLLISACINCPKVEDYTQGLLSKSHSQEKVLVHYFGSSL